MMQASVPSGAALPRWLIATGSAAIAFHLVAIVIPILNTPSGPWATPQGRSMDDPPYFAHAASSLATLHGQYLRVAHSFHFVTNRPGDQPGVEFEVRLRDADGKLRETLHFPDPRANYWVRHRQGLLASALAPDFPVEPPGGEVIAAPGAKVPTVSIWTFPDDPLLAQAGINPVQAPPPQPLPPAPEGRGARAEGARPQLQLSSVPQHLIPRDRGVMRPTEWALVLARAYARHLCRSHGAATAEIVRHTREPVTPAVLFGNDVSAPDFEELLASFGAMSPNEETSR